MTGRKIYRLTAAVLAAVSFLSACEARGRSLPGELKKASPESMSMNSSRLALIDSTVNAAVAEGLIPGAVVAVVKEDKLVYIKPFGSKSVVPDTVAMTEETVFDLASCSKCVGTTLSFMQLIEQGKVRLHDPVSRYIPGFRPWTSEDGKVDITVEHLLTHSSGIDPYLNVNSFVEKYGENQPDSLVRYISDNAGRNFRPGTKFMYSCLNFIALQAILEKVTGERLCDYAMENVFRPLGLKHTGYLPVGETPVIDLKYCAPTELQPAGTPLCGQVHDPLARRINGGNSGNAGVFSDAMGLSVICAAIMNGGSANGVSILSPAAIDLIARVPEDIDGGVGRALGWDHHSTHSGPRGDLFDRESTICHTGYTGPSIVIDMKNKTALIILAHRVHPQDKGSLARFRAVIANIVASSMMTSSCGKPGI